MTNAEVVFKEELANIVDPMIKKFVLDSFGHVPAYFWTAPCSSTGKYHPRWNQGDGGIIRHTRITAFYAGEITRAMPLSKEDVMRTGFGEQLYRDVAIAASLLHDGWKHGKDFTGDLNSIPQGNSESHGINWAKYLYETIVIPELKQEGKEAPFKIRAILRGIAGHMGIWTGPTNLKFWPHHQKDTVLHRVCMIVHLADYISSRKPSDSLYQVMDFGR